MSCGGSCDGRITFGPLFNIADGDKRDECDPWLPIFENKSRTDESYFRASGFLFFTTGDVLDQ